MEILLKDIGLYRGWAKLVLQLWVHKKMSLCLYYYHIYHTNEYKPNFPTLVYKDTWEYYYKRHTETWIWGFQETDVLYNCPLNWPHLNTYLKLSPSVLQSGNVQISLWRCFCSTKALRFLQVSLNLIWSFLLEIIFKLGNCPLSNVLDQMFHILCILSHCIWD